MKKSVFYQKCGWYLRVPKTAPLFLKAFFMYFSKILNEFFGNFWNLFKIQITELILCPLRPEASGDENR